MNGIAFLSEHRFVVLAYRYVLFTHFILTGQLVILQDQDANKPLGGIPVLLIAMISLSRSWTNYSLQLSFRVVL